MDSDPGNSGKESGEPVMASRSFDSSLWAPEMREYGIHHLLLYRTAMESELAASEDAEGLHARDIRVLPAGRGRIPARSDEDDDDSSGMDAPKGDADTGHEGAWWKVRVSLQEGVVVREGVSIKSPEIRRVRPGALLQQLGPTREYTNGQVKGLVRLPVHPRGWVTLDATAAGGPRYMDRVPASRWRVVHKSSNQEEGDVIVREDQPLDSGEVAKLSFGTVVTQSGPIVTRTDGLVRMPVIGQKPDVFGWVTVDASAIGGPVFLKPHSSSGPNQDAQPRRQRRPRKAS